MYTPPIPNTNGKPITKSQSKGYGFAYDLRTLAKQSETAGCGDYATYREMLNDPTIALCQAAAAAPIRAAGWSVEADDDAPDEAVSLITDIFESHRPWILQQAVRSIYYGWQGFEKVWTIEDGYTIISQFKPLLPDWTEITVDEYGTMTGMRQHGVMLDLSKSLVISYDVEGDNWYGRSRMENLRRWAWAPWKGGARKLEQYQTKTAGVIPMITYPEGEGFDENGGVLTNYQIAVRALAMLSQATGIAMPNTLHPWAEDALRNGANLNDLLAWKIQLIEPRAGHGAEFVGALSYQDKLKARGYLIPERAILEGQYGTKAEAGTHGDVALSISQSVLDDIVRQINMQAVDDVLSTNFGPDVRGKVYLKPAPIEDDELMLFRELVNGLYTSAPDLMRTDLDMDAVLDRLNLPKAAEDISEGDPFSAPLGGDATAVPTTVPAGGDAVQDTALTGIQITALRELAQAVIEKQTSPDVAKSIAYIAFPSVDRAAIDAIFNSAATFTPATAPDLSNAPSVKAIAASLKAARGTKPGVGNRPAKKPKKS